MKLYFTPNSNPRLALTYARYLGFGDNPDLPIEFINASTIGDEGRKAAQSLTPMGLFPILQENDGSVLWEADSIACRLSQIANPGMWVTEPDLLPQFVRWLSWCGQHLNKHGGEIYFERVVRPHLWEGDMPEDQMNWHLSEFAGCLAVLDTEYSDKDWLFGERLTYADFRVATILAYEEPAKLDLAPFPNVQRFVARMKGLKYWADPFAGLPA
ncbi:MAG: glutathione S-transferase family protein [Hyphomicrobiaceae bacterium]|nr:glutathione S-transferase family protein [Hyphomicrobiaceae bacterium]MCC0024266.1 glutathione S-transferase family protein [Hyphomicrobiaceae bacterium]